MGTSKHAASPTAEALVADNINLVYSIALKVYRSIKRRVELDELVSLGTEGLIQAAHRYRDDRGASFQTFAYYRIRGAIYDGLGVLSPLPRPAFRRRKLEMSMQAYLEDCETRGTGTDDVEYLWGALKGLAALWVASLDTMRAQVEQTIPDSNLDAHQQLEVHEVQQMVRDALDSLGERERYLLEQHYFADKTLQDAGRELGISKSWACRMHAKAINELRDAMSRQLAA